MNAYRIKGNWNDLKERAKEKWGELTDDELDRIDGSTDQLVGAVQKHYGRSRDQASSEVSEWCSDLNC